MTVDHLQTKLLETSTKLREAEERLKLYEPALLELASCLSVKHALIDLRLSQSTITALRASLEAVDEHGQM